MSLIHADGFGLYGTGSTGRNNMLAGVYASVDNQWAPSTANPRSAGLSHMRFSTQANLSMRRVLGADFGLGLGFAAAFFHAQLPSNAGALYLFQARDGSNNAQWSLTLSTTGVLEVRTGGSGGTIVAQTASPVIVASAYQHLELFATCAATGNVEVRVNGVTVLNAVGVNTKGQGGSDVQQYAIGVGNVVVPSYNVDVADMACWSTAGSVNNDFLGDVQWLPWFTTANGPNTGWTPDSGTAFSRINETRPDGDTSYVAAAAGSGAISDFAITDVPAATSDIIAVITQPMLRKTDAGAGSVTVSVEQGAVSPGVKHDGADIALTQVYTYYPQVHETDPNTGVRWTPTGFNSARVRLARTA